MKVVELRQYTLHPGQRDVLIELFDREFLETQDAVGATVLGQFRDLDDPDRFVWLRGFADMPARARALTSFYTGPTWKANSAVANATMIDSDDVLLLRPVNGGLDTSARRPGPGGEAPSSAVLATICLSAGPPDAAAFDRLIREAGAAPLASFVTEYAENTFPALPVRTGEHAFVWLTRFGSVPDLDDHLDQLKRSEHWQERVLPALSAPPVQLRLSPTSRSALR